MTSPPRTIPPVLTILIGALSGLLAALLVVGAAHLALRPGQDAPTPPPREAGVARTPPADLERVCEASERWEEDDGYRREWLFRSSREVLAWFGTPERVSVGTGGGEYWTYTSEEPDHPGVTWFRLSRDRLIHVE